MIKFIGLFALMLATTACTQQGSQRLNDLATAIQRDDAALVEACPAILDNQKIPIEATLKKLCIKRMALPH